MQPLAPMHSRIVTVAVPPSFGLLLCHNRTSHACRRRYPSRAVPTGGNLVDLVLEKVADTDGGLSMPDARRSEVDDLLEQLEAIGARQQPRPLQNPTQLFGNFNVAYTSSARSSEQQGQPAGGRFRSRLGRSLFRTTGLYQSVIAPDLVTNKVAFSLFGAIPGAVGLRGRITPVPQAGNDDTVEVRFEPPVLSLAGDLHVRIGPPSSVVLQTTYLDDRVRLGKGSRGSRFVFTRGGDSDTAGMDKVGIQGTSLGAIAALAATFAGLLGTGFMLWATGSGVLRAAAAALWLATVLVGSVLRGGRIVRGSSDKEAGQGPAAKPIMG